MIQRIKNSLKKYLITGFIILIPIGVTFQMLKWIMSIGEDLFQVKNGKYFYYVPEKHIPEILKDIPVPGIGFLFLVIVILVIGLATTSILGNKIIKWTEEIILKIPYIRKIYQITKQITETVFKSNEGSFHKVVLIEYPKKNIYAIGFQTGQTQKDVLNIIGKKMVNVFVPTTPNPTSGYLFFVSEEELIYVDITVEEAIKIVLSGGLIEVKEELPIIDTVA
jgi:uncharacterized membrane protein